MEPVVSYRCGGDFEEPFDYMIIVIAIEATLLVIVLAKLGIDCIRYNRTGELPWVARHCCFRYYKCYYLTF